MNSSYSLSLTVESVSKNNKVPLQLHFYNDPCINTDSHNYFGVMASVAFYLKLTVLMKLDKKSPISKERESFYLFLIQFQLGLFYPHGSDKLTH